MNNLGFYDELSDHFQFKPSDKKALMQQAVVNNPETKNTDLLELITQPKISLKKNNSLFSKVAITHQLNHNLEIFELEYIIYLNGVKIGIARKNESMSHSLRLKLRFISDYPSAIPNYSKGYDLESLLKVLGERVKELITFLQLF